MAKWDVFILNTLPGLRSLYLTFTGPELSGMPPGTWDDDLRCPHCSTNKKQFVCDFQPNTLYHDYAKGKSYIRPDVVVAFNCGLYRETGFQGTDSWDSTIPYLLKVLLFKVFLYNQSNRHLDFLLFRVRLKEGVPLILTAYTAREAPLDLKRLQDREKSVEVLLPPQRNPYRSTRPCRNFVSEDESPVIFKNQYITVVRKKNKK